MSLGAFAATHLVPPGGLSAYERADPTAPVIATLEASLEVAISERFGDWAHIVCSNGWGAWVDGRVLVARPAALGPAVVKAGVSPVLFAAIALVALGMFLPWIRGQGLSGNSFDVPTSALWSAPESTTDGPVKLWVPLAVAAIVGVVGAVRPGAEKLRRGGGIAVAVMVGLYVVWLFRLTGAVGVDLSITDLIGVGPPIVASGGLLLAFGKATQ